ncbi:MAG: PD40 domain-containing protein [Thermoleophilia bacterium]|nr:PD40 domain-containing protein [Thermoleophilia bacterium]
MRTPVAIMAAAALAATPCLAAAVPQGATVLIDRPAGALPGDGVSGAHLGAGRAVSADGRLVVFTSGADGLDPGTADDAGIHCYVRDTLTGATTLLDRADGAAGPVADADCANPAISPDGTAVAFTSAAGNLVPGDTNGAADVFVRDGAATLRASVSEGGQLTEGGDSPDVTVTGAGASREVRVTFTTVAAADPADANGEPDVYQRRIAAAASSTVLVSRAAGPASPAAGGVDGSQAADGTRVAFLTDTGLDAADGPGDRDAYVKNLPTGAVTYVSRPTGASGAQNGVVTGVQLSRDASGVAFSSSATNLGGAGTGAAATNIYLRRPLAATTVPVSVADGTGMVLANGFVFGFAISDDGNRVAFASRSGNLADGLPGTQNAVHVRDVAAGRTILASRADGAAGAPAVKVQAETGISGDGVTAVFDAEGHGTAPGGDTDANQVYTRDLVGGVTRRVSRPAGAATDPAPQQVGNATLSIALADSAEGSRGVAGRTLSRGGRWAVFASQSDGLLPGAGSADSQVFMRDVATGEVTLLSRDASGAPGTGNSSEPVISADGGTVAFTTTAANLGAGVNSQVVLWRRDTGALTVASTAGVVVGDGASRSPALSADGGTVAFSSTSTNLGVAVPAGTEQVWVRNRSAAAPQLASRLPGGSGAPVADGADSPAISGNGSRVAFATRTAVPGSGDTGTGDDVYVRDLPASMTMWASRPDGTAGAADGLAGAPALDADGAVVAFAAQAPGLTADDPDAVQDVFTRNLVTGRTVLVSRAASGTKGDGPSGLPVISDDGTRVAFTSSATNLVPGDADGTEDVFLRDATAGTITGVSRADGGGLLLGSRPGGAPGGSPDLACIAFESTNPALVADGYRSADLSHVYLNAAAGTCGVASVSTGNPGPTLRGVSLRPARIRQGGHAGLRFTLAGVNRVAITVRTARPGRVAGGVCRPRRTSGRRCVAWVDIAHRTVRGRPGVNVVRIATRWGRVRLKPGAYRIGLRLAGGGAGSGERRAVRLTILPRR